MSSCSSCGRPVEWAVTGTGKGIPIDPGARADGNIARQGSRVANALLVKVLRKGESHADPLRFVSHFATCPNADKHRKRKPASVDKA